MLVAFSTILVFSILVGASDTFGKGQSLPVVMSKQYGYGLQQSREGIPVLITKTFLNTEEIARNITVIFDIRIDDVTFYLALKDETALPRSGTDTLVSWTPQIAGEYQIRSFVVSNLTNPEILENVATNRFHVMSDADFKALYADRPTSFPIVPVDPVQTSPSTLRIELSEKQNLGSGLNMGIGDIAISDNGLYVVGTSEVPPIGESPSAELLNQLVYFIASNDRGLTFEPMRYLVNNTQALTFTSRPLVHAVNDTFHYVSWLQQDYDRDKFKLVVGKSFDGGKMLRDTISLDYAGVGFGDFDMHVSVDGKSVYIVSVEVYNYAEPRQSALVLSKSTDYANSFTPRQVILNYTGSENVYCDQMEVQEASGDSANNKVYVTWRQDSEDKSMKLLFTASYDNGATFSTPVVVREAYTEDYDCPTFASHGDDVYLFWAETKLIYKPEDPSEILVGDTDIFFVASRDNGRTFEPPVNLSKGIGAFTSEPAILVSDGRIYAVWRDTIPEVSDEGGVSFYGNAEVIMTRSLDRGRTFERPVNLSNNPTGSYAPEIAVHGDNVYIIWMESTFPSNEAKVSLRMSGDGGKSFGATAENIAGLISEPFSRPRVLTSPDGEQIYIMWSELSTDETAVLMDALTGVPLE
jgi:hypothetical protein